MKLKPPAFLANLYADLRDRRLLIPAIALLAGLVAVPMLLAESATTPPPPASSGLVDTSAGEPAVLTEDTTVRDYRDRLDQLQSKNPFRQDVIALPAGTGLETQGDSTLDGTGSTSGTGDPGLVAPAGTSTPAPSTGSTTSTSDTGTDTTTDPPDSDRPEFRTWTYELDVRTGPVGDLVLKKGVRRLDLLPSGQVPVVAYLGATVEGGLALFAVSSDVTAVSGNVECYPAPDNCVYLGMAEGRRATFDYEPDATQYRLQLKEIHRVRISNPGKSELDKLAP